ncbi:MAG: nitrate reductase cytochrome c-type subunit [Polyangiaceae bacterium]
MTPRHEQLGPRVWSVLAAATLTTAAVGYMSGTRAPPAAAAAAAAPVSSSGQTGKSVPTYRELIDGASVVNTSIYASAFDKLVADRPSAFAPVEIDESRRDAARAKRRAARSFDGAPPVIPHAIDQRAIPDCLVCHETGATIAGRIAAPMSHRRYDNCVQCHVVGEAPEPLPPAPVVENSFEPWRAPTVGVRAIIGAPPAIPHSTHMRENCSSCHGALGTSGIRTSHPYRQSCPQCHASSAELDRRTHEP